MQFVVRLMMKLKCNKIDCLWNDKCGKIYGECRRDEILLQPTKLFGGIEAVCRCFSRIKIRGHIDWSRYPKGGSLDDKYADRLANDKAKHKFQ
jgi:hypothetical protein